MSVPYQPPNTGQRAFAQRLQPRYLIAKIFRPILFQSEVKAYG